MHRLKSHWSKSHPTKIAAIAILLTLTATQFTNCGGFQTVNNSRLSSFSCDTPDCVSPDSTNLKITPMLDSSGTFNVNGTVKAFNLGGTCNEGGFPSNTVKWELLKNGSVIRSSDMPVVQTTNGFGPATSMCKSGRFSLYVNLGAAGGMPDLTPLPAGYQLRVTLSALGSTAANAQANAVVTLSVQ